MITRLPIKEITTPNLVSRNYSNKKQRQSPLSANLKRHFARRKRYFTTSLPDLIFTLLCLALLRGCINMTKFCINLTKETFKKMLQRKLLIKPCFKKLFLHFSELFLHFNFLRQRFNFSRLHFNFTQTK